VEEARPEISAELRRSLVSGATLLGAGANVVMQLSRLEVGRAVVESPLEGALLRHPWRRTRTTLGYVMAALFGTEEERRAWAREVGAVHRRVVSAPGADVAYRASDANLQLWVAMCMYRGVEDVLQALGTQLEDVTWDDVYRHCARFATTLGVAPDAWPRDRAAFAAAFEEGLALARVDVATRSYLLDLLDLRFAPRALWPLAPLHRFVAAGFLPDLLAEDLGVALSERARRRHRRLTRAIGRLYRRLPRVVAEVPWNLVEAHGRRRVRTGRALLS
jgi:uncharacterized protein (DUF2236 family)